MAKALAGFKCRPLGKHCNGARRLFVIRYARYYTLSEVRDYWRNKTCGVTVHHKSVAVQGSPCAPTPHTDTDAVCCSTFLKRKVWLVRLCICPHVSLTTFENVSRVFVKFNGDLCYWMWPRGHMF
jgi:hypothetical protein